ncbi:MAG: UbiA family prenyltransferase [Clostridia bacterium]|nr:UbiA family prenyltransferase [Clostridia bacterium]
MIKRWHIYLKEMYPVIPRLFLGIILFGVIYFFVLAKVSVASFSFGMEEVTGVLTIFFFLLCLRIADEFKDFELDSKLFKERPLPSGRVTKNDLKILAGISIAIMIILNVIFTRNLIPFIVLAIYGILMSVWFFAKKYIQPNLLLALITHNPVQVILNFYIISIVCNKYQLELFTLSNVLIACILYLPALGWEMGRKIKAPQNENEYVTYSKIFGYKRATIIVFCVFLLQAILIAIAIYDITSIYTIIGFALALFIYLFVTIKFIQNPTNDKINPKKVVPIYIYVVQIMLIGVILANYIW